VLIFQRPESQTAHCPHVIRINVAHLYQLSFTLTETHFSTMQHDSWPICSFAELSWWDSQQLKTKCSFRWPCRRFAHCMFSWNL